MAITFPDTGGGGPYFGTTATLASQSISASATFLYVGTYRDNGNNTNDVTGITFDGNAMTFLGTSDNDGAYGRPVDLYEYDTSALGATTADIVVSIDVNSNTHINWFTVTGTSVTRRAVGTFLNGGGQVASFDPSVTSNSGDTVIGLVGWDNIAADSSITKVDSQTLINYQGTAVGGCGFYYNTGDASSTNMEWTIAVADDGGAGLISLYEDAGGSITEPIPNGSATLTGITAKRVVKLREKIPQHGT